LRRWLLVRRPKGQVRGRFAWLAIVLALLAPMVVACSGIATGDAELDRCIKPVSNPDTRSFGQKLKDSQAEDACMAEIRDRRNASVSGGGGGGDVDCSGVGAEGCANMKIGHQLNAARGWDRCWPSLRIMWIKESGWRREAVNQRNHADFGIPQMNKRPDVLGMSAAEQIKIGLNYIAGRYGDPCKAWAFWQNHTWY
jgi:hypothetical protein